MKILNNIVLIVSFLYLITSCMPNEAAKSKKNKLSILTTTGMIEEAAIKIVGDSAKIDVIVPLGVDPHTYQPSQKDLSKFNDADIIICNGFHLEGKMHELFEKLSKQKPVIFMSAAVPSKKVLKLDEHSHDPHIWLDTEIWQECIAYMASHISKENPELSEHIQNNLSKYLDEIELTTAEAKETISSLPENQRYLITSHDAFGYFGKAFNLKVMGIKGFSTANEASIKHVNNLIDVIINNKIKTIFPESSVSPKDINTLVERCKERGNELSLGEELFSDSMGEKSTPAGTYCGMISHNVNTIVNELK